VLVVDQTFIIALVAVNVWLLIH